MLNEKALKAYQQTAITLKKVLEEICLQAKSMRRQMESALKEKL